MNRIVRCFTVGAVVAAWAVGAYPQDAPAQRPTAERLAELEAAVTRLESAVATLDTRLALQSTRPGENPGQSEVALAARVMTLERNVERLSVDLQRAERVAGDAARAASAAQRDAMNAQQAARDAALRAR